MRSIIRQLPGTCYLCEKEGIYRIHTNLHRHHIFGGTANRKLSERYGLTVNLCPAHHVLSPYSVHQNAAVMRDLRKEGQRQFERRYPELNFRKIFGKNYL